MRSCADQFVVKYWEAGSVKNFKMSKLVKNDVDAIILTGIKPEVTYTYQAIAREDKGILGVDYNRSPLTTFRASRKFTPRIDKNEEDIREAVSTGELTEEDIDNDVVLSTIDKDTVQNSIYHDSTSGSNHAVLAAESGRLVPFIPEPKNKKNIWMLGLGIIGGVIVILLVVGITYNCIRRVIKRKKYKNKSNLQLKNNDDTNEKAKNIKEKQPNDKDSQKSTENESVP